MTGKPPGRVVFKATSGKTIEPDGAFTIDAAAWLDEDDAEVAAKKEVVEKKRRLYTAFKDISLPDAQMIETYTDLAEAFLKRRGMSIDEFQWRSWIDYATTRVAFSGYLDTEGFGIKGDMELRPREYQLLTDPRFSSVPFIGQHAREQMTHRFSSGIDFTPEFVEPEGEVTTVVDAEELNAVLASLLPDHVEERNKFLYLSAAAQLNEPVLRLLKEMRRTGGVFEFDEDLVARIRDETADQTVNQKRAVALARLPDLRKLNPTFSEARRSFYQFLRQATEAEVADTLEDGEKRILFNWAKLNYRDTLPLENPQEFNMTLHGFNLERLWLDAVQHAIQSTYTAKDLVTMDITYHLETNLDSVIDHATRLMKTSPFGREYKRRPENTEEIASRYIECLANFINNDVRTAISVYGGAKTLREGFVASVNNETSEHRKSWADFYREAGPMLQFRAVHKYGISPQEIFSDKTSDGLARRLDDGSAQPNKLVKDIVYACLC